MKKNITRGFTLIEVLLVIAILAILAAVVIIAINPAKQLGEANNAQRRSDVRTILDAVQQYSLDNGGLYPDSIQSGGTCMSEGLDICQFEWPCDGINLDILAENQVYLTGIPIDPSVTTDDITGYKAVLTDDGRLSVCAPLMYGDEHIVVTQ